MYIHKIIWPSKTRSISDQISSLRLPRRIFQVILPSRTFQPTISLIPLLLRPRQICSILDGHALRAVVQTVNATLIYTCRQAVRYYSREIFHVTCGRAISSGDTDWPVDVAELAKGKRVGAGRRGVVFIVVLGAGISA